MVCWHSQKRYALLRSESLVCTNLHLTSIALSSSNQRIVIFDCKGWELNKDQMFSIFNLSHTISSEDWGSLYYTLPCSYKGELIFNKIRYSYKVNAGSYAILYNQDTSIYLVVPAIRVSRFS
jgi:hypothetical protein